MGLSTSNFSDYSTILFIDSMVALEAKPLPTLPWCEIDATGPVLLLVVPQVNKEIDKRKRDGRLGKRAREFNRLIRPAALSRSAVQICAGPPAVDLGIAALDRIDWDALNDLDPEEPDACVIAQILHARGVPLGRKLLLSDDTNPISMATRHGLRTQEMPTHWRLEPEPSPHEKEISRLKARVKELESTEPELKPSIEFSVDAPLQLFQVRQLSDEEKADLVARILAKNPRAAQNRSVMLSQVYYDHTFDERYERYRIEIVPRYAATLHRHLETLYGQVPFLFRVENVGHVQAENLVVTLTAIGGRLHDRFACYALFGPLAPQPRPHDPFQPFDFQTWPLRPGYAGRHEMDFAVGPNRGDTIEVHCQDFRQGVPWQFSGIATIDPYAGSPFKIHVRITASNSRGAADTTFELQYTTKSVAPNELISLKGHEFQVPFPMAQQFDEAVEAENCDWFDTVDDASAD